MNVHRALKATCAALLVTTLVGGCGGDDASTATNAPSGSQTAEGRDITVASAWARTSPSMTMMGAVYMDITSVNGDELVSASVDASVAADAQIHETVSTGMPGAQGEDTSAPMATDMTSEMTMKEVDSVSIPAGGTVSFEPGGYHIMLIDLASPLEKGRTFEVTLTFAMAGEITVVVEVRDDAP